MTKMETLKIRARNFFAEKLCRFGTFFDHLGWKMKRCPKCGKSILDSVCTGSIEEFIE